MLPAAVEALAVLMDPMRLLLLAGGVLMGLFLGIVPGIGGLAGMALLLPFTYTMDPYSAFAMLLGMAAVTGTSDTIPAVLFAVPGSAGAQATVMDGNPMAKRGQAGRALSAAYTSSLIGGLFGALILALCIPVLRPLMLHLGSPELLALSIFGISMVAVLSGSAPLRGLIAAGFGIMLSMIGSDPQTGTLRWTMDTLYLWEGLPVVPVVLGLFALPELADLAIKRQAIASSSSFDVRSGMLQGMKDALRNWWLVLRCGAIGAAIGAIPGLGASVVDWIAYGHAMQTVKGGNQTFGKGDVRGVIAPESANNAITAGSLVPTIAFGVPGSASMAILLGVFLIHGLIPGPDMLTKNLSITYSMIWSIAIANILGAGICFVFSGQLAKIALLRYTVILPGVITFVFIGAYQATRDWGDLYTLILLAILGWIMKFLKWPRPPLILGFVLGALIERYMFITATRYGYGWFSRPIVLIFLVLSILLVLKPVFQHWRSMGGWKGIAANFGKPELHFSDLLHVFVIAVLAVMLVPAVVWPFGASVGPLAVGGFSLFLAVTSLLNQVFSRAIITSRQERGELQSHTIHMDMQVSYDDMSGRELAVRVSTFFFYLVLFLALIGAVGFILTIPIFTALYMWLEGRENWKPILGQAVGMIALIYIVFDTMLHIPWPATLLGQLFPALRMIPAV
ncbi:tripartite tricarboxylate transporter permease [Neorhizobium sp. DT-125]|uniref:tripartite tricarboxylate transporter permease n=1 Tax=Neorhizobium sp. DT-125 TaxID=3396163 RepID=UPI003F1A8D92